MRITFLLLGKFQKETLTFLPCFYLAGSVAGILLSYGVANLIMTLRPQFLIVFDPSDMAWALTAGLGMALAAALFPARVIAGLAPAEVFRK